jgi:hypothetical protein
MTERALIEQWRQDADRLREWGAIPQAEVLERAAGQLEAALHAEDEQLLTLDEAAEVSGYSTDHLGRLLRKGALANQGCKHRPRVRKGDLPGKPSSAVRGRATDSRDDYNTDRLFRDIKHSKTKEH